jgi:NADPH-dependent ferric siderophore reductase
MARTLFDNLRLDRTALVKTSFAETEERDLAYWRRMTPRQRVEYVETLRQLNHADYDPDTSPFSRVYTITQQPSR